MQKLRENGGIKLIQTKIKSETPKIEWLINMITDETLKVNLGVFKKLVGIQKGNLQGEDVIFAEHSYITRTLNIKDPFYTEALIAISKLSINKHVQNINNEHLFYNPVFTTINEQGTVKTIKPFTKRLKNIKTYGDLLKAQEKETSILKLSIIQKINSIDICESAPAHQIVGQEKEIDFKYITQKFIYQELIQLQSRDHFYQTKWPTEREDIGQINWKETWENVHNNFNTTQTKSIIWEQIHLNFYTTYNYNKWHNTLQPCPLCNKIPEDIFHIILDCKFTNKMWMHLEKTLLKIIPIPVTTYEKAFGLQTKKKMDQCQKQLRNWLTFTLRYYIMQEERKAYYKKTPQNERIFIMKIKRKISDEIKTKEYFYKYTGRENYFEKIITAKNAITEKKSDGTYHIKENEII